MKTKNSQQANTSADTKSHTPMMQQYIGLKSNHPAIRRLLDLYKHARRHHLHLEPADIGVSQIGHFAYFNSRFADSLWPLALRWLQTGAMPAPFAARLCAVG